ncbi:MAG: B12-binding domain-containing radical SAM protein [Alphaproteobacteria bacterium]|nr:B12-binding domain-containing radical SAM protein [Alphaproteobacteria bacterium]
MAHIQLIGVSTQKDPQGRIKAFPYAFPIIIQQLRKTSHTFHCVDTHLDKLSLDELLERVATMDAGIFGISGWSHNYPEVKAVAARIRELRPEAVIIVGGVLTGNDEVLMRCTETDIASTGAEGEFILPEILDRLDAAPAGRRLPDSLNEIKGITFRDHATGTWHRTLPRPVQSREEFQKADMPAYDYFRKPIQELVDWLNGRDDVPVPAFPLLTMRGCPFPCTFCGHNYGRRFLRKKWDSFFDEVQYLIDNFGARGFYSQDTNMFLNRGDVDEYCRIYAERGCTFTICVEMRTTFGDVEMFRQMWAAGVRVVLFGFESGSQRMLDLMRKNFALDKMKPIIRSAIEAGMHTHGNFLYGTPGENWQSMKETRAFQLEMERWIWDQDNRMKTSGGHSTSGWGFTVLIPSPTSELYKVARDNGLIVDEERYLESLGGETTKKLLKGSNFKIRLADGDAGDVNMSEFTSHAAMVACMRMNLALVKLQALCFSPGRLFANLPQAARLAGRTAWQTARYAWITTGDRLAGRKGPKAEDLGMKPRRASTEAAIAEGYRSEPGQQASCGS